MINIPNILTLSRIALIPIFVGLYYLQQTQNATWANVTLVIVFCITALTDYLDGYLARKLNISTKLGAFLDPVADKLMVATALVLLIDYYDSFIITLPALIIIMREILVSALREWMSEIGKRTSIAVSYIGKFKTSAQLLSIAFLLDKNDLLIIPSYQIGLILFYVAMILTLWSGSIYLKESIKTFDR